MKKDRIFPFLLTIILIFLFQNSIFSENNYPDIDAMPSQTGFRLTQIPLFYKNNLHKEFEKYELIYPTALIIKEKRGAYYFSLDLEISPQYIKLSKKKIFNLLITAIPTLHFQNEAFRESMLERVKNIRYHVTFDNLYDLYRYALFRVDKLHEQDFLLFEHMILFLDLILDNYNVYISHTVWNFYSDIEKKSSYAYFKCTLDTISIYKLFSPYPVHGKKAPLLRALDMVNEEWEKSFFENYEADFPEK